MKTVVAVLFALAVLHSTHVLAQGNAALAGTWTVDRSATQEGRGRGIAGIPVASTMTIKIAADAVTVDTDTGSGQTVQSSVYKLDGSMNTVPGPLGWDTKARAAWEGDTLVVTTRRSMTGPTGPMGVEVKDVYAVSGDVLTIERTMGRATQKLTYTKGAPR
jgi:hypothetical protein